MIMNIHSPRTTGSKMMINAKKCYRLFSVFFLLFAMAAVSAGTSSAGQSHGGQFVRIGLNKSIVVRLPANAQDVLIGNPDIVDAVVRTQRTAYLFAKKPGQTNAFFFDSAGRQILNLDIEVARDMKALQKLLKRVIPGNRITVETVGENIVLGGTAKSPAQARLAFDLAAKYTDDEKKVLSAITVAGREQVTLKVRVTEMKREVLKQLGVDTNATIDVGSKTIQLLTLNPFGLAGPLVNGGIPPFGSPGGVPGSTPFGTPGYGTTGTGSGAVLRAMERDGLVRTLAEPNLTAISGESAKFLAGGEFPIVTQSALTGITVEYKPFGIGLGFTPVVLSEGRISLKLNTEVSDISPENSVAVSTTNIPAFTVRRAETTVELPSGGSLAMAGLIKNETKQQIAGIPGMKNLPILGTLFRSRDFATNQTELVIIVTPYIVRPVNEKRLVTPVDKAIPASDTQAILFGRLNRVFGAKNGGGKVYHGNVGFIVE